MAAMEQEDLTVRDATEADLPALTELKASEALHRDRIRDADRGDMRYLVQLDGRRLIAHALLIFENPQGWPAGDEPDPKPNVVDLLIDPDLRSRGYGAFFMREMEAICRDRGEPRLYLAVDPVENPRALAFYLRIGYRKLSEEPHRVHWKFTDSDGNVHEGRDWNVGMVKELRP